MPYLSGEQALFDQFHLDEPWDSPHNRTLLPKMPKTFGTPAEAAGTVPVGTKTYFRGFAAPGAMMEKSAPRPGKPRGPNIPEVKDGLEKTIFCVEAGEAVEWTKPDDLTWTPGQALPALGGHRAKSDVFLALFLDRKVRPLKKSIAPEKMKAAVTYAGNDEFKFE